VGERVSFGERARGRAKEDAEKVAAWTKSVPQRLKPYCKEICYGTDKSVPLSKTVFLAKRVFFRGL
jgi:hypothetical protein